MLEFRRVKDPETSNSDARKALKVSQVIRFLSTITLLTSMVYSLT